MVRLLDRPLGRRHAGGRDARFNGYTRLDTVGHPHSDALHLTHRFTRLDRTRMAYTVTVEDSKTYTKAWTNERIFRLMDAPLLE